MSAYVTKPISTCERVSRALSALLSELHFPTRALGPITEARDLLLRAALDANEFYSTERDELTRDVVKLRADLAAAVAERDRYHYQALTLDMLAARTLGDEPAEDAIMEKMDNLPDSKNPSGHLIACVIAERDQLRARLAAIDAAPVAAWQWMDTGHFRKNKPDGATVFNWRPLYAAPPAPVAEIREVVHATAEMSSRVANSYFGIDTPANMSDMLEVLRYWRRELGPTLGLVELREPTDDECTDMAKWFKVECEACCINPQETVDYGRAIFDAVKIVMFPQESEVGL